MVEKEKPQTKPRGRPRKFDADDVLDTVIDVFWELGYDAADTETLSRRTGLTKPSLYNAFGSKEDLFVAALDRYRNLRSKGSVAALTKTDTPAEGIMNYFLYLAQSVAAPDRPKGCLMLSIALPLKERLPKVAEALANPPNEGPAGMMAFFEGHKQKGHLPDGFDISAALSLLHDFSAAMIVQARAGAPLDSLKAKAVRNAELVLYEGKAPHAQ